MIDEATARKKLIVTLDEMQRAALRAEAQGYIDLAAEKAAEKGVELTLTLSDFSYIDGEIWLDGMDPKEWIEAQLMD